MISVKDLASCLVYARHFISVSHHHHDDYTRSCLLVAQRARGRNGPAIKGSLFKSPQGQLALPETPAAWASSVFLNSFPDSQAVETRCNSQWPEEAQWGALCSSALEPQGQGCQPVGESHAPSPMLTSFWLASWSGGGQEDCRSSLRQLPSSSSFP